MKDRGVIRRIFLHESFFGLLLMFVTQAALGVYKAWVAGDNPYAQIFVSFIAFFLIVESIVLCLFYVLAALGKVWALWVFRILILTLVVSATYLVIDPSELSEYRVVFSVFVVEGIFTLFLTRTLSNRV